MRAYNRTYNVNGTAGTSASGASSTSRQHRQQVMPPPLTTEAVSGTSSHVNANSNGGNSAHHSNHCTTQHSHESVKDEPRLAPANQARDNGSVSPSTRVPVPPRVAATTPPHCSPRVPSAGTSSSSRGSRGACGSPTPGLSGHTLDDNDSASGNGRPTTERTSSGKGEAVEEEEQPQLEPANAGLPRAVPAQTPSARLRTLPPVVIPRAPHSLPSTPQSQIHRGGDGLSGVGRGAQAEAGVGSMVRYGSTSDITKVFPTTEDREYLSKHREMSDLVDEVYSTVVAEKPTEPLPFIIEHLRRHTPAQAEAGESPSVIDQSSPERPPAKPTPILCADVSKESKSRVGGSEGRSHTRPTTTITITTDEDMEQKEGRSEDPSGALSGGTRGSFTARRPQRPSQQQQQQPHMYRSLTARHSSQTQRGIVSAFNMPPLASTCPPCSQPPSMGPGGTGEAEEDLAQSALWATGGALGPFPDFGGLQSFTSPGVPPLGSPAMLHVSQPPSALTRGAGSHHTLLSARGSNQGTPYTRGVSGLTTFARTSITHNTHSSTSSATLLLERQESSRSEQSLFSVNSVDLSEFLQEFRLRKNDVVGCDRDCVTLNELSDILELFNLPHPDIGLISDLFTELSTYTSAGVLSATATGPLQSFGSTATGCSKVLGSCSFAADNNTLDSTHSLFSRRPDHTAVHPTTVAAGGTEMEATTGDAGAGPSTADSERRYYSSPNEENHDDEKDEEPTVNFETLLARMAFMIQGRYPLEVIRNAFFSLITEDGGGDVVLGGTHAWSDATATASSLSQSRQTTTSAAVVSSDPSDMANTNAATTTAVCITLGNSSSSSTGGTAMGPSRTLAPEEEMDSHDPASASRRRESLSSRMGTTAVADLVTTTAATDASGTPGVAFGVLPMATTTTTTSTATLANCSNLIRTVPLRRCLTEGIQRYLGLRSFTGIDVQQALRCVGIPEGSFDWGCHLNEFVNLVNTLTAMVSGGTVSGIGSSPVTLTLSTRRETQGLRSSVGN